MKFYLFLFLIINLLFLINSQKQDDIVVFPTNNNIIHSCFNDVYQFQFDQQEYSTIYSKVLMIEKSLRLKK